MKPKIIIDREPVSSEEILSRRNFQRLVSDVKLMQKPFFKSTWFISSIAATALLSVALLVFLNTDQPEAEKQNSNLLSLSSSDSSSVLHPEKMYAEDSPCIQPPVKNAEKKSSIYTISNEKGATIVHPSGTVINIPKEAVQDANGNTVDGSYEIHYREYHSLEEIILSGIPMTYDSAGTRYHFESAGMIDISATQNGKTLQLAKDKQIEIQMVSGNSDSRFNHYYLDTNQRNWVYLGKEKIRKKDDWNSIILNDSVIPVKESIKVSDSIDIDWAPEIVVLEKTLNENRIQLERIEKKKPIEPKKVNPQKHHFNLDVDPREFPELSAFKNTLFEVGPENRNFSEEWYKQNWNSVKLSEHVKGISFKLDLLKVSNGISNTSSLIVYPVYEGKNYEEALRVYENQMNSYTTSVSDQKKAIAQKEKELKDLVARKEKELAIRLKTEEAERKKRDEFRARQLNNNPNPGFAGVNVIETRFPANYTPQQIADFTAFRTFQIMQFGVYNSDCAQKLPRERILAAVFMNKEDNKMIIPSRVFLVDQSKNISYSYYQNALSTFGFDPASENAVLIFLKDGKAAYFKAKDFNSIPGEGTSFTFMMSISSDPISKESDLKHILSL